MDKKALVVTGFGINCERETARACELAGVSAEIRHLNDLLSGVIAVSDYSWILFPGGFSYGDELGAGKVLANKMSSGNLKKQLRNFVADGGFVTGICNGFQFLLKLGLLPFSQKKGPRCALLGNASGRFENRWCDLKVTGESPYTHGLTSLYLPVRHGEGRFVGEAPEEQVVLRYASSAYPHNPNGSQDDIAGIVDETGRVFGLMPHPEAYVMPEQHPAWTQKKASHNETLGLELFGNVVESFRVASQDSTAAEAKWPRY